MTYLLVDIANRKYNDSKLNSRIQDRSDRKQVHLPRAGLKRLATLILTYKIFLVLIQRTMDSQEHKSQDEKQAHRYFAKVNTLIEIAKLLTNKRNFLNVGE